MKKVLLVILGIFILGILGRNIIAEKAVEIGTRAVTGAKLDIGKLKIGLLSGVIDIKNIRLYNPKGFKDPLMVEIPEVYVSYKTTSLLTGKIHIKDIRLDLKEVTVVKNEEGKVNLTSLKTLQKAEEKKEEKPKEKPGEKKEAPEVNIESLGLKIGKVTYKDYSKGGEPKVNTFNINLDERHTDIKNLNAVVSLIVIKIMTKTTIGQLVDIDLGNLQENLTGVLKGVSGTAADTLNQTSDTLKKTTNELKNLLPFGK